MLLITIFSSRHFSYPKQIKVWKLNKREYWCQDAYLSNLLSLHKHFWITLFGFFICFRMVLHMPQQINSSCRWGQEAWLFTYSSSCNIPCKIFCIHAWICHYTWCVCNHPCNSCDCCHYLHGQEEQYWQRHLCHRDSKMPHTQLPQPPVTEPPRAQLSQQHQWLLIWYRQDYKYKKVMH